MKGSINSINISGFKSIKELKNFHFKDLNIINVAKKKLVLIVWRKLIDNLEEYNLMLDEWFKKHRISSHEFGYAIIYVNGSNNLPNLKKDDENW